MPPPRKNRQIVYKEETAYTTKLTLKGPTTFDEGQDLAIQLNTLIAQFNTLFFLQQNGKYSAKITAKTDPPS